MNADLIQYKEKKMKEKSRIVKLICIMLFLIMGGVSFGQEKVTDLKDKLITLNVENRTLDVVFCILIQKYDVPIGFESSTLDNDHRDYLFRTNPMIPSQVNAIINGPDFDLRHQFTVKAKDARLEDVLDQIVGQMKNYKWEINDDIVNIIPIKGRDERYKKLLELKIGNFTFKKNQPIYYLRGSIFDLPEIKTFLAENKMYFSKGYPAKEQNFIPGMPDEINFSNLSFRDLFNKITKVKRGGWYLRRSFRGDKETDEYIEIVI
jgi:hypothetical protein